MAKSGKSDSIFQTQPAAPPPPANATPESEGFAPDGKTPSVMANIAMPPDAKVGDAPADFGAAASPVGVRHTEALLQGDGTGNTEPPKTNDAAELTGATDPNAGKNPQDAPHAELAAGAPNPADPDPAPSKPESVARATAPATPEAKRFSTGFDEDDIDASPFAERKPRHDAAPNDDQMRYRVWDHGGFMHDGRLYPAGSHVNMAPTDAADAVGRGVLSLAAATAGSTCTKCGRGTNAPLPCSPECYAAAGYNPANFDAFVAERKAELARGPMSKR